MKRTLIAIIGIAVVVFSAFGYHEYTSRQKALLAKEEAAREAAVREAAAAKAKETEEIQAAINKYDRFAVTRSWKFRYRNPLGGSLETKDCCFAEWIDNNTVLALAKAGLLELDQTYVAYVRSGGRTPLRFWATPNGRRVLEQGEQKQQWHSDFHETLIPMGYRALVGIDDVKPLSDGYKVEFRWKWDLTDVGRIMALSGREERGEAYVSRTATGMIVNNLYLKDSKDEN